MSLDVYLTRGADACVCSCGARHEPEQLFRANITHNLRRMADSAGLYQALWRPEEIGITKAAQLIQPLRAGLALMRSEPERFGAMNAANGWGLYENFVPWIADYLRACEENPEAFVRVSR